MPVSSRVKADDAISLQLGSFTDNAEINRHVKRWKADGLKTRINPGLARLSVLVELFFFALSNASGMKKRKRKSI